MGWLDLVIAVFIGLGIVFVPGAVLATALGLRGQWFWGLCGPLGVSVLGVASVLAPAVGLDWGVVPVALTLVVAAVVVLLLRLLLWRRINVIATFESSGPAWCTVVIVGSASVLLLVQIVLVMGRPDAISQTFDNIFHLNAIRYAADTGNASPFFIGTLTSAGGPAGFYPSAWHALGSLLVITGGVSVTVASNAAVILFAAIVWPASILLLVRELAPQRLAVQIVAAIFAVSMPAFPMLMLEYGVLYPYMMAVSVVPAVLALVVRILFPRGGGAISRTALVVAALGVVPGLAFTHPSTIVVVLGFASAAILVWIALYLGGAASRRRKAAASGGVVVYAVVVAAAWHVLRPDLAARTWEPYETVGQALGEVATLSVWFAPVNLVAAALVITGLALAFRQRSARGAVLLGMYVIAGSLYVAAAALPYWDLRDMAVGPWYVNAPRLAALLPLVWVPLAAWGAAGAHDALLRGATRVGVRHARPIVAVLAMILLLVPSLSAVRHAIGSAVPVYRYTDDAPLISSDELALLDRLPAEVPADAKIIGSPWTGAALAYALADREVLLPHTLTAMTSETREILDGLDTASSGSAVCDAVIAEGVEYVLDFGDQEVNDGRNPYPGLQDLEDSPAVTEIDAEGEARLYRITACG